MYAIIECGGKQYRVSEGDRLQVEKIKAEVGSTVMLDQVLLLGGEKTIIGTPVVDGAAVSCKVLRHDKEKKILVFHYKAKKNIRKRYGHRQPFTSLLVESIIPSGYVKPVAEAPAEAPVAKATKAEATVAIETEEPVKAKKATAPKTSAKKKEAPEAAALEPAVEAKKPAKRTAAKKTVTETEPAATAEEKPAKKTRAKKTETPEA